MKEPAGFMKEPAGFMKEQTIVFGWLFDNENWP
jgi:hypothetical protein